MTSTLETWKRPVRRHVESWEDAPLPAMVITTNYDSLIERTLDQSPPETTDDPQVDVEFIEDLPRKLVEAYIELAVTHAIVREVDPGVWLAEVVALEGAMASGDTDDEALHNLPEIILGWVAVKRRIGAPIPAIEGLNLNVPE